MLAATDLVAWTKLIAFPDHPDVAACEIDTFRYRVLHVAARITRGARQLRVRIDATARVTRSILWDDIEVGPDCTLDECIVTDGVRVPPGAIYRRVLARDPEFGDLMIDAGRDRELSAAFRETG